MSLLSHILDKRISHLLATKIQVYAKQQARHPQHSSSFLQVVLGCRSSSSSGGGGGGSTCNSSSLSSSGPDMAQQPFLPERVLVLRKFSRVEYERLCHPHLTEEQLALNLKLRGSAYETLIHYDQIQKSCLRQIETTLADNRIDFKTVDRFGYTDEKIDWADVIVTSGGDGTFLMAASKVPNRDKLVIGVNSDPTKSVGHLCLPSKYSNNFDKVIDLLKTGKYQWQFKQRLRITLVGDAALEDPRELNDIRYNLRGINQFLDQEENNLGPHPITTTTSTTTTNLSQRDSTGTPKVRQLKERALNEVFVGETLSARVSYYEFSVDNNKMIKMKSSGLTVCTGTGSTSWYYNINKLTEQQIRSVMSIINKVNAGTKVQPDDKELIGDITRRFNETLTFSSSEPIMAYSVRDPVDYASAEGQHYRGKAKRVEVKSRMQNACLVLDGCQFYPFNDGSYALIEMYDEDALRTVSIG